MVFSTGGTDNLTWPGPPLLEVSSTLVEFSFFWLSFRSGTSLILAASWVEPGSNWPACSWSTPGGHTWRIENGLVVDEQGVEVEGVQVWEGGDEDKEVCGVKILVCSEVPPFFGSQTFFPKYIPRYFFKEHRGRWMVTTQLEDGRQLTLALETEDDVGNQWLRVPLFPGE